MFVSSTFNLKLYQGFHLPDIVPEKQRRFAIDIVRKLRAVGFEAYWAGGCVRDQLLGREPHDYDVATSAEPPEIRNLFGKRRTLPIGAAFGVITVLGPRDAGQIEVATFRRDARYSDGRHPDSVTFSTAREDATRRDFTINGLFYDPIEQRVIDFVDGRKDLKQQVIRAIGLARERFTEDKLRMLRAVRFSATLDFSLDENTLAAVREMAPEISVVSAERIAGEMERMLVDPNRTTAVRLLLESGLAAVVLPEIVSSDSALDSCDDYAKIGKVIERLSEPSFPLALAALLYQRTDSQGAIGVCRRWRMSNSHTDRVGWLLDHRGKIEAARAMKWSALQKILVADGAEELLALEEAVALAGSGPTDDVDYCRSLLQRPREELDPPPLLTGDKLLEHGVPAGPAYRLLLEEARNAQLDELIHTKAEALELVDRLIEENNRK